MALERRSVAVWADWVELGGAARMGSLPATPTRGKEVFSFEYDHALQRGGVSADRHVEAFKRYMDEEGARVTRAMFEQNLRREADRPDVHRRHGAAAGERDVVDLRRGL